MAKHHILCIHGIGKHSDNWIRDEDDKQSFMDLLREKWEKYPVSDEVFEEAVELHSIHYDDEINKIFGSWEEQSKNLKNGLSTSPLLLGEVQWFTDLVDTASAAKNEGNWQYTHLMDLLLFIGSPSIQDRLVTYVGNQIIRLIQDNRRDDFSIIGHSMGTAMVHKVVQALFNEGVKMPDGSRQTLKGDFRFQNICMIANTSYSLSRDRAQHYTGIVRPSSVVGEGCCYTWVNVNHRLDPVGRFMPFDYRKNPLWLDPRVDAAGYHKDLMLSRISSPTIHSINHYFRDPSFHIPYFQLTFGRDFTKEQMNAAIDEFEATTPEGAYKSLKSHMETLDVSNTNSMRDFFQAIRTFLQIISNFN